MTDNITEKDKTIIATETDEVEARLEENAVLSPELIAAVKKQVTAEIVEELKEKKVFEEKEREIRRESEDLERANYVAKMKASDEPWVDFEGTVRDTEHGQRIQLEWNDAFIVYLREAGIDGTDEEQVVQKYIALLMRDMTDRVEDRYENDSDFQ